MCICMYVCVCARGCGVCERVGQTDSHFGQPMHAGSAHKGKHAPTERPARRCQNNKLRTRAMYAYHTRTFFSNTQARGCYSPLHLPARLRKMRQEHRPQTHAIHACTLARSWSQTHNHTAATHLIRVAFSPPAPSSPRLRSHERRQNALRRFAGRPCAC